MDTRHTSEVPETDLFQSLRNRQFLIFPLKDDVYGLDICCIKEIIEYSQLTEVPMVPAFIRGVLNLRGSVIPVIDLYCRFSGNVSSIQKRSCIVVVDLDTQDGIVEMGMLVDAVQHVIELDDDDIGPAPSLGTKIRTDFIAGMGNVGDRFIVLLQIDQVLSLDELSILQAVNDQIDQSILQQAELLGRGADTPAMADSGNDSRLLAGAGELSKH